MLRLGWWYQGVGGKASMRFEEKVEVRVKVWDVEMNRGIPSHEISYKDVVISPKFPLVNWQGEDEASCGEGPGFLSRSSYSLITETRRYLYLHQHQAPHRWGLGGGELMLLAAVSCCWQFTWAIQEWKGPFIMKMVRVPQRTLRRLVLKDFGVKDLGMCW